MAPIVTVSLGLPSRLLNVISADTILVASFGSFKFHENATMESALLKDPEPGLKLENTAGRLSILISSTPVTIETGLPYRSEARTSRLIKPFKESIPKPFKGIEYSHTRSSSGSTFDKETVSTGNDTSG